jgi:hypothetical protein
LHRNKKQWLHKIAENNGCAMNVSDLTFWRLTWVVLQR